jgi:hypothetical protein
MAEFGRKGIELLREIVNTDQDQLSQYNVSPIGEQGGPCMEFAPIVLMHSLSPSAGGPSQSCRG